MSPWQTVAVLLVAEVENPQVMDANLAKSEAQILDAESLQEAAWALLRLLADLIPGR